MHETLIEKIVEDKLRGVSDKEIGDKYGLSLREIEKAITKKFGVNISNLHRRKEIRTLSPKDFKLETSTVWSFKSRGNWATHNGDYRGNWSPYIPRNVILRYSQEGDFVLDYFCGAGTTGVECKLLNRNFIGLDINPAAIELTKNNINFEAGKLFRDEPSVDLRIGDARDLSIITDESIDLICAHPPYANIIHYTENNPADLSHLDIERFLIELEKVAKESFRVTKYNKYCAILIGDMRKDKKVVPLGFRTIEKFLEAGFQIQDLIIKRQHNCKTTGFWYNNSVKYNFLLLAHEYLVVFKKLRKDISKKEEINTVNSFSIVAHNPNIVLEGTTCWIFNHNNWYENSLINLTKRYSNNNYQIYFEPNEEISTGELLITFDYLFIANPEKVINSLMDNVAIICTDLKLNNHLTESTVFKILKIVQNSGKLKIKEIIIVSLEDNKNNILDKSIKISHKYILLFQREK